MPWAGMDTMPRAHGESEKKPLRNNPGNELVGSLAHWLNRLAEFAKMLQYDAVKLTDLEL